MFCKHDTDKPRCKFVAVIVKAVKRAITNEITATKPPGLFEIQLGLFNSDSYTCSYSKTSKTGIVQITFYIYRRQGGL